VLLDRTGELDRLVEAVVALPAERTGAAFGRDRRAAGRAIVNRSSTGTLTAPQ
jgi:hypothetical protein